jgi:co-chaperonin GroES (HSP10)
MKALGQKCFILPDWEGEEKSPAGLHLPQCRMRDLPRTGTVKSMPAGDHEFKEGDKVVYDFHKQQLIDVPGEGLTLAQVKIKDVLAVL